MNKPRLKKFYITCSAHTYSMWTKKVHCFVYLFKNYNVFNQIKVLCLFLTSCYNEK